MGGGGSTTKKIRQNFNMESINKSIYEELNDTRTESVATQTNLQKISIVVGNNDGCPITAMQNIDATTQSSTQAMIDKSTEIKAKITNEMQAAASAAIEKTAQMGNLADLGLGGDTEMDIETNVRMKVSNIIENKITNLNINTAIAEQVSIQNQEIRVGNMRCVDGVGGINLSQNITAQVAAKAITDELVRSLAESEIVNKLAASADANATKKDGGIAEAAEGIGQGFANVAEGIGTGIGNVMGGGQMASAASACVLCIAILAALYFMMSPAGQGATKNFMKKRK
jgi:hypothetical protein